MPATLLRPDEVERIRDWATSEYKKKYKNRGTSWNGRIPTDQFVEQLRIVLTLRERRKANNKASKLSDEEITRRLLSIEADLRKADKGDGLDLEEVLRFYSTDPKTRFDIQFVRGQQRKAEDSLGLWVYIPFLALFCYFLVDGKGLEDGYWMNAALLDKFLDEEFTQSDDLRFKKVFYDIASDGELWEFVEGPLIESLWINDDNLPEDEVRANQFVQTSNMPVGAMRLRQLRVEGESCGAEWTDILQNEYQQLPPEEVIKRYDDFHHLCYRDYVPLGFQKTAPTHRGKSGDGYTYVNRIHDGRDLYNTDGNIVGAPTPTCNGTNCPRSFPVAYVESIPLRFEDVEDEDKWMFDAYVHRRCSDLNSSLANLYHGKAGSYGCDGFALVIPFNWTLAKVKQAINTLKTGIRVHYKDRFELKNVTTTVPWVDVQTRGIAVEMFMYNQNIELFSRFLFFVELTASGAWVPLHQVLSFKFFSWDDHSGGYFFFMFVFFLWIVAYVAVWFLNIAYQTRTRREQMLQAEEDTWRLWFTAWGAAMLSDFWIWFDLVNLSLFLASWGLRFRNIHHGLTKENLLQNIHYPDGYEDVAFLGQSAALISAFNAMLVFLRIFYFLKLNPRLNLLTRTIGEARDELVAILIIFAFVFIAFALMCYVVYGHVDENYRTFGDTARSLMLMLLGDFDYIALRESQRIFTPIFFALFQILAVFLLFNMVIAVLGDAFSAVQENKYHDRTLVRELIQCDPDKWQPGAGNNGTWKVPHLILRNSLVVELVYWFKYIILTIRYRLFGMGRKAYLEEYRIITEQNPRLYWKGLEDSYYANKKSTNFRDNLQLHSKVLDDYLEEKLGRDASIFLYDKDSGAEGMVLEGARRTHVPPEDLLMDMMEYHHSWSKEMKEKTHTGNAEDYETMKKQRHEDKRPPVRDEIDELFSAKYAANPQKRWEEQKAKLDQLRSQLYKLVPDTADGPRDKCVPCGTKKQEVLSVLEGKVMKEVEGHIDEMIKEQITQMLNRLVEKDMPSWILDLVADGTSSANGSSPRHGTHLP